MLTNVIYFQILGKPLIMYMGILTLLAFLFTASIAIATKKGIKFIAFKWHRRMAYVSIGLAVFHGLMGILIHI